jgi:hypothetical protein
MKEKPIPLLKLKKVQADSNLIKLLPVDVACQYHAIPISTDGQRITVAMAHPEDIVARDIVTSAIGAPACLVKSDQQEIDQMLSRVWHQNPTHAVRLLLWIPEYENGKDVRSYTRQIAELLHAELKEINTPWLQAPSFDEVVGEAKAFQPDLFIFQVASFPIRKRLLVDFAVNELIDRLPSSILVVKKPRWPLQKILFAIRDGHESNESTVDWVIRLAHNSHASVTMLPLLPPIPEMYGRLVRNRLTALMTSNDPLGEKMRAISSRMAMEEIAGTIKLRNGPPLDQIRSEVLDSDTDILTIAADPQSHLWRWIVGELVNDLFVWFDRSLLITK